MLLSFSTSALRALVLAFLSLALVALLFASFPIRVQLPHWTDGITAWHVSGHSPSGSPPSSELSAVPACGRQFDSPRVAVAVKTGATEAVERIPMLMLSALSCAQHVKIYSDLEQDIAGWHLTDALQNISEAAMHGNSDFDFYYDLQEAQKYGQVESMLRDVKDPRMPQSLAAWTLDKYKFLHILEDIHDSFADAEWFMLIDADTYVVWDNLMEWLDRLPDPSTNKMYIGSAAQTAGRVFAHGGSGILISRAALHELAVVNRGLAASWDEKMHDECCGDLVIGDVFRQLDIPITYAWPTLNGEKPKTMPFGPKVWCHPLVTMHHMQPAEMSFMAELQLQRQKDGIQGPLTFADLYTSVFENVLPEHVENWYNQAKDKMRRLDSYDDCLAACQEDEKCFQFSYHEEECALGYSIHFGGPTTSNGDATWQSGWLRDRIKAWVDAQPPCSAVYPGLISESIP